MLSTKASTFDSSVIDGETMELNQKKVIGYKTLVKEKIVKGIYFFSFLCIEK